MLAALQARAYNRLADALEVAEAQSPHPCERLLNCCRTYLHFGLDEPVNYKLLFNYLHPRWEDHPDLVQAIDRTKHTRGMVPAQLVEQEYFIGDPVQIGYLVWTSMHGILSLHALNRSATNRTAETLFEAALACILARYATAKWAQWVADCGLKISA